MAERVVITGMGVVSGLGCGTDHFFDAMMAARSAINWYFIGDERFIAAPVTADIAIQAGVDRYSQFALMAADQALRQAGLTEPAHTAGDGFGIFVGSSQGGANTLEKAYSTLYGSQGRVHPLTIVGAMHNAAAAQLSLRYHITGPTQTYSVACASSAVAIGEACRAIRHGYLDAAIAGGAEAELTFGTLKAWQSMKTLARPDEDDPASACRPFAGDRSGLVLGEGAGMLVLESLTRAIARGATILAEVAGYGLSSDASHLTKPDNTGQASAMRAALRDAGVPLDSIGYINAHGTATHVGDISETVAIRDVFGAHANQLAVSSTKSMHGHLLGATGAVEFIASICALQRLQLPPTRNLTVADPECDLDYVPNEARTVARLDAIMSNSFAFGGSNVSLIATRFTG